MNHDTIIAHCTPTGSGAIALLRLSGSEVRSIVGKMAQLASGKKISDVPSHTIHYGAIIDDQHNVLDTVLFMVMDAPRTFTGEHVIEISCHNNQFIIQAIIAQAIKHGARLAYEGEFTKRAFMAGKIDLLQAEAINELIGANTQLALKKSLAQLDGSFSQWVTGIEKELIRIFAWCEASFEFLDDEAEFGPQIKQDLIKLLEKINTIKKTFDIQLHMRQGIRTAFIGSVNAGKSSLFNALLDQKRSIVTDIAGTTRDTVEAGLYRNGTYWTLVDTAGLRQTDDIVEQEGIKRSFEEANKADIIVLVFDGSRRVTQEEIAVYEAVISRNQKKVILVQNKVDLQQEEQNNFGVPIDLELSATCKNSVQKLEEIIAQKIALLFSAYDTAFLVNKRQAQLLLALEQKLQELLPMLDNAIQYELVSYHLKEALETISELTGKSISEAGLDAVFKEFCVGK